VPREAVDLALQAARQAPSACNRQAFVFRIFDEPGMVRNIADLPGGVKGFCHNFPALAVLVGQLRAYSSERDRHLIFIDASLAAMSFMLALETLGMSSCPINWPEEPDKERAIRPLLKLAPDERVIMMIVFGYPDPVAMIPHSHKKNLDQIRVFHGHDD
jgi:nitroreductase